MHGRRDPGWVPPSTSTNTGGRPPSGLYAVSGPCLDTGAYPETAFAILSRAGLALDFVVIAPAERAAALDGVVEKEVAPPVEAAVLGHLLVLSFVLSVNRRSALLLCAAAGRGRFGEVDPDAMDGGFLRAGHFFAPFPWVDKPFAACSGRGGAHRGFPSGEADRLRCAGCIIVSHVRAGYAARSVSGFGEGAALGGALEADGFPLCFHAIRSPYLEPVGKLGAISGKHRGGHAGAGVCVPISSGSKRWARPVQGWVFRIFGASFKCQIMEFPGRRDVPAGLESGRIDRALSEEVSSRLRNGEDALTPCVAVQPASGFKRRGVVLYMDKLYGFVSDKNVWSDRSVKRAIPKGKVVGPGLDYRGVRLDGWIARCIHEMQPSDSKFQDGGFARPKVRLRAFHFTECFHMHAHYCYMLASVLRLLV